MQKLPDLVTAVASLIVTFLTSLAGEMPSIISAGADLLINFLNGLASKMPDIVSSALNLIVQFINGLASKAGDVVDAGVNLIVQILQGIANNIRRIVDAGMDIVDATVEGVIDAQDRLFTAAEDLIRGFADNIRKHKDDMRSAAGDLLDALASAILPDFLYENGKAIVGGFKEGLENAFEGVKNMVSGWADTIASLKGPIPYDKKVLIENGLALVAGLKTGLTDGFSDVKSDVSTWANELQRGIESEFDSNYFNDLIGNIPTEIPAIKALTSGIIKPELASGISKTKSFGSSSGSTINNHTSSPITINNQGMLEGAIFQVREEADVHKIAKEINDLTTKEAGNKGFRRMR